MAVLVVDDDATVVNLVTAVLHRAGIDAEVALDGPSALARLGRGRYRAVLSDLTMPGMSGLQLLREARARGHALPFLIMTAYLVPEAETALRAEPGVAGVLRKPFDIRRLVEEVTALLQSAGAGAAVIEIATTEAVSVTTSVATTVVVAESSAGALLPLSLMEYVTARLRRQALIAQAERRAAALRARPAPEWREAEQGC